MGSTELTLTLQDLFISDQAYKVAKDKAKENDVHMCDWISKAILEQALLESLVDEG